MNCLEGLFQFLHVLDRLLNLFKLLFAQFQGLQCGLHCLLLQVFVLGEVHLLHGPFECRGKLFIVQLVMSQLVQILQPLFQFLHHLRSLYRVFRGCELLQLLLQFFEFVLDAARIAILKLLDPFLKFLVLIGSKLLITGRG